MSEHERSTVEPDGRDREVVWDEEYVTNGGLRDLVSTAVLRERNERRWSQARLADKLAGIGSKTLTRAAIAAIETGTRRVDLDEAFYLCQVFALGLAALLERGQPEEGTVGMPSGAELAVQDVMDIMTGGQAVERQETTYAELADVESLVRSAETEDWVRGIVRAEMRRLLAGEGERA